MSNGTVRSAAKGLRRFMNFNEDAFAMNTADNKGVIDGLKQTLADTYALQLKTQNYHWNIKGPSFFALHKAFEEQYNELFPAVDEIAERIRALGDIAPGGFKAFAELSGIDDGDPSRDAKSMVDDLIAGHETVIEVADKTRGLAENVEDAATADMLTARIDSHQSTVWMLRSFNA